MMGTLKGGVQNRTLEHTTADVAPMGHWPKEFYARLSIQDARMTLDCVFMFVYADGLDTASDL
jgi:hypothetical protein